MGISWAGTRTDKTDGAGVEASMNPPSNSIPSNELVVSDREILTRQSLASVQYSNSRTRASNMRKFPNRIRLASMSLTCPDPEAFEFDRTSVKVWSTKKKPCTSAGVSVKSRDLELVGENVEVLTRGSLSSTLAPMDRVLSLSSNILMSNKRKRPIMSKASLSIASPDPEKIGKWEEWEGVDLGGGTMKTYRESIGNYASFDTSITLTWGVIFCKSFQQYHKNRDKFIINDSYEIHLEEYNKRWAQDARQVCELLEGIDSAEYWDKVQHIGSTAIPDMVAKPVIDIMITIKPGVNFKWAIDQFLREQVEIKELPVMIGFTDKAPFSNDDWGFFQIPRPVAKQIGMCEVNIHVFNRNTQNALEKSLFRDFLTSSAGADLKKEYCDIKRQLLLELSNGLPITQYALRKNDIVAKILNEATFWSFETHEGKKARRCNHNLRRGCNTCPPEIKLVNVEIPPIEAKQSVKLEESDSNENRGPSVIRQQAFEPVVIVPNAADNSVKLDESSTSSSVGEQTKSSVRLEYSALTHSLLRGDSTSLREVVANTSIV